MNRPEPGPARAGRPLAGRFADVGGEGVAWAAAGFAATLVLGVLLEPLRGRIGLENVVIGYLAVVLVCAAIGGRAAGMWTSLSAALSYNFFFTTPYRTLRIDSLEQVVTVILLFAAGMLAANAGRSTRRIRARERQETDAIRLLNELAHAAASGHDPDRLAADGMLDLLDARRVQIRRGTAVTADAGEPGGDPDTGAMARLDARGHLVPESLGPHIRRIRLTLPRDGAVVPLIRAGREVGAIVIVPGQGRDASGTVQVALAGIAHTLALAERGGLPRPGDQPTLDGDGP